MEIGTSNSSLSAGKSPQLFREQQIPKPTPRKAKTMEEELPQRQKTCFSDGAHSPSIHTPVLSSHCDHAQVPASSVINILFR